MQNVAYSWMSAPSSLPTPTATPRLPKGTLNANGSLNRTQQAWPGDAMTRHCSSFCVLADRHTPAYKSRQSEPSERSRPSRGAASSLPALLGFPPLCRSPRLSAASRCPRACAESHGHGHYGVNSLPSLHVCSVPSLSPLSLRGPCFFQNTPRFPHFPLVSASKLRKRLVCVCPDLSVSPNFSGTGSFRGRRGCGSAGKPGSLAGREGRAFKCSPW